MGTVELPGIGIDVGKGVFFLDGSSVLALTHGVGVGGKMPKVNGMGALM